MPKRRTNPAMIREEVRKTVERGKTRKRMACGHEDDVYANVNEIKEVCWSCRLAPARKSASNS